MVRDFSGKLSDELATVFDENDTLEELEDEDFDEIQKDRYITFMIGEQTYGVEILYVTEIVGLQNIAVVPDVPSFVKGMINLRGNVIPVVDVRLRFKMDERPYTDRTCVIVVTIGDDTVGMIVDAVEEVSHFPQENISAPPVRGDHVQSHDAISGLGKQGEKVTLLLDLEQLLLKERAQT
jgi:purine-binding chemotaxis protein CheW